MILIGIGGNLPSRLGNSVQTLTQAIGALDLAGIQVMNVSPFYQTAPVPISDQPWYVNAVIEVETHLSAAETLAELHKIEADFGRQRRERNEPRPVDLDLLCYHQESHGAPKTTAQPFPMTVPHPRMQERAFVLYPLRDVAPNFVHPSLNLTVDQLIANLPDQQIQKMSAADKQAALEELPAQLSRGGAA